MDGAGAKHHFSRSNILKSAGTEAHAHTSCAAPFEDYAIHQRITANG
jgi:hypothetical protein